MAYISGGSVMTARRLVSGLSFKARLPRGTGFAHTPRHALSTRATSLQITDIEALKVNQERMMNSLHQTCAWGMGKRWGSKPNETGMSRLALSDTDKQARDWFVETTTSLGCDVKIDAMGNIFAVRPGRLVGSATFAGSHLDTQPSGGRYDGILGITAGIEMLKVLNDHKVETEFPVGVVNWTNEEGARFPISMVSSGVWAGMIPLETAHNLREVGGGPATMKSELERIGYLGSVPASHESMPMAAHFELHIEQGPILEKSKQKIGIVEGVQAYRWFTVDVIGREGHTGTTPFEERADAMLLAAQLIVHTRRLATAHSALASVGILNVTPGSTNTIPGHVSFTIDVRAPSNSVVDDMETDLKRDFDALANGQNLNKLLSGMGTSKPLKISWRTDSDSSATLFNPECIEIVRASAEAVTREPSRVRMMRSGAGHDSVYASRRCPTSMIFVPSKNGVSHNPEEYTSPEDCALGAEVLMQSVLRYDHRRALAFLSGEGTRVEPN
ncbi:hypothetical protein GGS21DRAFT_494688 [Xylaria nigripes]|nr:hypothetical protein GGS21DRAFT_494688 [Xylaria nigripes]